MKGGELKDANEEGDIPALPTPPKPYISAFRILSMLTGSLRVLKGVREERRGEEKVLE